MKRIVFSVFSLLMTTCQTIEIPIDMDSKEKPVFEITGTLGNKAIGLAAGKDNFVLSTSFENLKFQVLQLTGNLKAQSCDLNCKPALRLNIRQHANEFNSRPIKAIGTGKRSFYKFERDSILIKSDNQSTLSNTSNAKLQYAWTVNDKKHSTEENIILVNNGLDSKICLTTSHPDGGSATNCQIVDFTPFDSLPGLRVNLVSRTENKMQKLAVIVNGKGPFKYSWDGNKSTDSNIDWDGKQTNQCVTVIDVNGNKATDCIVLTPEGRIKLKSEFKIEYESRRILEIAQFNTVELHYIDTDGVVWSSSIKEQHPGAVFEIVDEMPYDFNDKGQPTRKLKIKMDCSMFTAKGESSNLKLTGTMGVAIPPK